MNNTNEKFQVLTKYIQRLEEQEGFGEWIVEKDIMPFVNYSGLVSSFVEEFYSIAENSNYDLKHYVEILEKNNLKWDYKIMQSANIDNLNEEAILALIMSVIRAERFCDGVMLAFFKDGTILNWLKKLKELDLKNPV